jgi:hypothetical protein
MPRSSKPLRRTLATALALLVVSFAPSAAAQASLPTEETGDSRPAIALMGTIPIYWGEVAGIDEILRGGTPPHWARGALERRAQLVPIDYLSEEALGAHRYLLLAQPRGLTAQENVALDRWVRGGGQLLAFVDPWMTGESRFGIGDRRRPQDVALLSPILAHWGLELLIDAAQPEGLEMVDQPDGALPVNMRGIWVAQGDGHDCALGGSALLAHCRIGQGQALLVADAAMLDLAGPYAGAEAGFESLLARIFPQIGESAGTDAVLAPETRQNAQNRPIPGAAEPPGPAITRGGEASSP